MSLVIPTYKRLDPLRRALENLQHQVCQGFEILVVDNDPQPGHQAVIESCQGLLPLIRYIPEPSMGLHFARHAGARAARGDLLVFTDDDATFDPVWLRSYQEEFDAHPEMAAAGGPVRPVWEVEPPQWLLDYVVSHKIFGILSLMEPYQEFQLSSRGFFFGVNMAIRKDILFQLGGFNPDSFGDTWLGDGESGLVKKLRTHGLLIGYVPGAGVQHHIPAGRMTLDYIKKRMANQGAQDAYRIYRGKIPSSMKLLRDIIWIIRKHSWKWIRSITHRRRTDKTSIALLTAASRSRSKLMYTFRLMTDQKLRKLVQVTNWLDYKP